MVPDIAGTGRSFKGAMAYYLHDKRQGDGPHPETAERVAWSETRNLMTDDPERAQRIMIATALSADQLKESAGVKATGRKSNKHVYAYSLAWHPDEAGQLDRGEMIRAADESLKALGADHLQAVIVAHTDQKHPHVHVVVNRVDPNTGKLHTTSNDRLKISDWAYQYERERGQILTPAREERRQLREQFKDRAQRADYAAGRRQEAADRPAADKSPAAVLKALTDDQKAKHRQEWGDLSRSNRANREAIYRDYGERIKKAAAAHKLATKPQWAQHFCEDRADKAAFDAREKRVGGIIQNAMTTTAHQAATGKLGERGRLSATFGNVLSSQARQEAFKQQQDTKRQTFAGAVRAQLDREVAGIKAERSAALAAQRQSFDVSRSRLIDKQNDERAKIREAWQQLKGRSRTGGGERGRFDGRATTPAQMHARRTATKLQVKGTENPARDARQDRLETGAALKARESAAQRADASRPVECGKPTRERETASAGRLAARAERKSRQERLERRADRAATIKEARQNAAPNQEGKPVKDRFDQVRRPKPRTPSQTETKFISRPSPAPSPSGDAPRPAQKEARQLPKKEGPARAGSTPAKSTPAPKKDWSKSALPPQQRVQPPKDWSKPANEKPREIKPLPQQSRDKDRER